LVQLLLSNIGNASTALFILSFALAMAMDLARGRQVILERALTCGLSMASAPTGIALMACAFKPDLIQKLEGASLSFAVGGAVLLFISVKYGIGK